MGLSRFNMAEAIQDEKQREQFEKEMDELISIYEDTESINKSNK